MKKLSKRSGIVVCPIKCVVLWICYPAFIPHSSELCRLLAAIINNAGGDVGGEQIIAGLEHDRCFSHVIN